MEFFTILRTVLWNVSTNCRTVLTLFKTIWFSYSLEDSFMVIL